MRVQDTITYNNKILILQGFLNSTAHQRMTAEKVKKHHAKNEFRKTIRSLRNFMIRLTLSSPVIFGEQHLLQWQWQWHQNLEWRQPMQSNQGRSALLSMMSLDLKCICSESWIEICTRLTISKGRPLRSGEEH